MIKKRLFFKKNVIIQSSFNLIKYSKFYAGYVPTLTDTEIFKLDWKINLFDEREEENIIVSDQVSDQVNKILVFCSSPRSLIEIMSQTKYTSRVHFRNKILKPLIEKGLIKPTAPDKPNSPKQKYLTVGKE